MIQVLVSQCLQGVCCRYDGHHSCSDALTMLPSDWLLIPVCPEVELGLGTPRNPVSLLKVDSGIRLVDRITAEDLTEKMLGWCQERLLAIEPDVPAAAILKSQSPSCGLADAECFPGLAAFERFGRLKAGQAPPRRKGGEGLMKETGFFAAALQERFPGLPMINEVDLCDVDKRDEFIEFVVQGVAGRNKLPGDI